MPTETTAHPTHSARTEAYTIRDALREAHQILDGEFGQTDLQAAVSLASFLYTVKVRDEVLGEHIRDETAYGAPG